MVVLVDMKLTLLFSPYCDGELEYLVGLIDKLNEVSDFKFKFYKDEFEDALDDGEYIVISRKNSLIRIDLLGEKIDSLVHFLDSHLLSEDYMLKVSTYSDYDEDGVDSWFVKKVEPALPPGARRIIKN